MQLLDLRRAGLAALEARHPDRLLEDRGVATTQPGAGGDAVGEGGPPPAHAVGLAARAVGAAADIGVELVHDRVVGYGGTDDEQAEEHQLHEYDERGQAEAEPQRLPHRWSGGGNRR